MEDTIFNTEEKREKALFILKEGQNTPFWHLMVELLTSEIEILKEHILVGNNLDEEPATKEEMDHLRDKLRMYQDFILTPQFHIDRFVENTPEETNLDPFLTAEELKKQRKNNNS